MFKIYSSTGKIPQVIKVFAWNFDDWHSTWCKENKSTPNFCLTNTPTILCLWAQKYAGVDKHSCTQAHINTHTLTINDLKYIFQPIVA